MQRFEPALCIDRSHATGACCRDCLAVHTIGDVAGREHARDVCPCSAILCFEIPYGIHLKLATEEIGVRPVTDADQAFQNRTIEATETREEPVVSKQARVVGEVALKKEVQQQTKTVRDTVRKTDVKVEQAGKGAAEAASTPNVASSGGQSIISSEDFANEVAMDRQYLDRDWNTIEPEVRRTYEHRYPNSKWEGVKDSIQRAFMLRRTRAGSQSTGD